MGAEHERGYGDWRAALIGISGGLSMTEEEYVEKLCCFVSDDDFLALRLSVDSLRLYEAGQYARLLASTCEDYQLASLRASLLRLCDLIAASSPAYDLICQQERQIRIHVERLRVMVETYVQGKLA